MSSPGFSGQGVSVEPAKLRSIEVLRGVAASIVVFSHVARHLDRDRAAPLLIEIFQPGHAGVDLFFVISGFIILLVHRSDIGQPVRLGRYASRRFTRVLPLFWLALSLTFGVSAMGHHGIPTIGSMLWNAMLLPTATEPFLPIAWTLQYEAMFYVCFGLILLDRRLGLLTMTIWMVVIVSHLGADLPPALCQVFGLEFLIGMIAAEWLHRRAISRPVVLAASGGALFALAYLLESADVLDGYEVLARFAYGLPAGLMIVGLAASERAGTVVLPRWLEPLGRASYSIYLFQFLAIGPAWQLVRLSGLAGRLDSWVLFILLSLAALSTGLMVNRYIERPLLRLFRQSRVPGLEGTARLAR